MFNPEMIRLLAQGIWETLYMTIVSSLLAYVLGLPLGLLLLLPDNNGIRPMRCHSDYRFTGWNISWNHCNYCTACVCVSTLCRPNGRILFKGGGSWRG